MCENDAAVDMWIATLAARGNLQALAGGIDSAKYQIGHTRGVIRELAATVPGVREWLIEHPPTGE